MSKTKNIGKRKPMDRKIYHKLAYCYMTAGLIYMLLTPTIFYVAYSLTTGFDMALRIGIMAVFVALLVVIGILEYLLYKRMNKVQLGRFINRPDIGLEGNIEDIICSIKGGWEDNNIPGMEFVAKELRNMGDEHRARFVEACIGSAKEKAKGDKKNDLVYAFYRFKEQLELYFRDKETDSALTKAYCKVCYGDAYIALRKTKRHYILEDGTDVCVVINGALDEHDKDRITFSIYEIRNHEKAYSNSGKWIYDDIKDWNGKDFDKAINKLRTYAHETKLDGSD